MRVTSMVAGLAIVLAACGGEKKAEEQTTTTTPEQPAAEQPAAAPAAGGGAAHDVSMVLEGSTYKFDPAELTIKSGDVVNFIHPCDERGQPRPRAGRHQTPGMRRHVRRM